MAGSITLSPLYDENAGRQGVVRAELAAYSFELRATSGWDRGISGPVVLAYDGRPRQPQLLYQGDEVTWGSSIPQLSGGGRVTVTSLSNSSAMLAYWAVGKPLIVAGGGHLTAGGTILIGPDGSITHIPPGDPWGGEIQAHLEALEHIRQQHL
jgi:hypothetical protein